MSDRDEARDLVEREELRDPRQDLLPDVRDGLSRLDRVILYQLHEAQEELGGRNVPTALLYGRVVEHVDVSIEAFQAALQRLVSPGTRR